MEQQPERHMKENEHKALLLEYSSILTARAEIGALHDEEQKTRMREIEELLGLNSEGVAKEAYELLGSSVGN